MTPPPAHLRAIDLSIPSTGTRFAEEILAIILRYLCPGKPTGNASGNWIIDASLALCSLTCRHWAAQIRPAIFKNITLRSHKQACAFSALVRSSVAVPGPLQEDVCSITLWINGESRPWIYYVWALLRDGVLPNMTRVDLNIQGRNCGILEPQLIQKKGEVLLDVGLPRKLPSMHPICLGRLGIEDVQFRSYTSFLRSLNLHSPKYIFCCNVQWPGGNTITAPAERLFPRSSSYGLQEVCVKQRMAVTPLIWTLVTTRSPNSGAATELLYINATQINTVISMFRLFSDDCKCSKCEGLMAMQLMLFELQVYTGVYGAISKSSYSSLPDPADDTMRWLQVRTGYASEHTLTLNINPVGGVSQVCLMMRHPAVFLSPRNAFSSAHRPSTMLERFDQLCESLSDTLQEVVIAEAAGIAQYLKGRTSSSLVETMRGLRDQMPIMRRQQSLSFRTRQRSFILNQAAIRDVFDYDGHYWVNIPLDSDDD